MEQSKQNSPSTPVEVEATLAELQALLEEKDQLLMASEKMAVLGQITAGIAHEINTPLGALKSNYDLFGRCIVKLKELSAVSDDNSNQKIQKLLEKIDQLNAVNIKASERIVQIVNSVRRYARQDDAEPTDNDLIEIMNNTLAIVHHELKNRINLHLEFNSVPMVKGFPTQLSQVFLNILVNASHAIEEKGDIYVKTYTSAQNAVVEIRDTGKGMSPEKKNRIFEAGYTTKSSGVGMGLGLALVNKIINAHNGTIEVESKEGVGTTFSIFLPAHQ